MAFQLVSLEPESLANMAVLPFLGTLVWPYKSDAWWPRWSLCLSQSLHRLWRRSDNVCVCDLLTCSLDSPINTNILKLIKDILPSVAKGRLVPKSKQHVCECLLKGASPASVNKTVTRKAELWPWSSQSGTWCFLCASLPQRVAFEDPWEGSGDVGSNIERPV